MERIESHRSCYRRALSLFKEECGPVMTGCFSMLLSLVLLLTVGYGLTVALPDGLLFDLIVVAVMLLFFCLLVGPLWLGIGRWFYLMPERRIPLHEVFYYLEDPGQYGRACRIVVHLLSRMAVTFAVVSLPAFLLQLWLDHLSQSSVGIGVLYSIVLVLQSVAVVAGSAIGLYHFIHYFLVGALFYEQAEGTVVNCLRYSYDLMHRRRFDVLMLILSLFPIYLTWVLVLPILFTVPYLLLLCALKGRELLEESYHTT